MNELRYEKQIILKGFGIAAQQLLQDNKVQESYLTPVCNNQLQLIDAVTFKSWLQVKKEVQLIDVRTVEEFKNQSWPKSKNIPLTELDIRQSEIDFSMPVIIICQTGVRSKNAALLLKNNDNLRQVFSLHGGLQSLLQTQ